jgi:hypothetical protein
MMALNKNMATNTNMGWNISGCSCVGIFVVFNLLERRRERERERESERERYSSSYENPPRAKNTEGNSNKQISHIIVFTVYAKRPLCNTKYIIVYEASNI